MALFKKTIDLKSVILIRKTTNPLSAPALSIKRIEIMFDAYNLVLISPKNRDHFMALLMKKCPHAKLKS